GGCAPPPRRAAATPAVGRRRRAVSRRRGHRRKAAPRATPSFVQTAARPAIATPRRSRVRATVPSAAPTSRAGAARPARPCWRRRERASTACVPRRRSRARRRRWAAAPRRRATTVARLVSGPQRMLRRRCAQRGYERSASEHLDAQAPRVAVAQHVQLDVVALAGEVAQVAQEVLRPLDRIAVDAEHHVALAQARLRSGALALHRLD